MRVGIIGAGLGGLAAAARLAASGHEVSVFEQGSAPGGKASTEFGAGYRFDTGPSLLTMPEVFDDLFAFAGRKREDYLSFLPLDEICRYFFDDGSRISAFHDQDSFGAELQRVLGEPPEALQRYLRYCGRLNRIAGELFMRNSLHEFATYTKPSTVQSVMQLWRLDLFRSMDQAHRAFFNDPRTVQLFNRYATYNGSNPYKVPATLNIIPAVEYLGGAYAVDGGIHALPRAIESLGTELGVVFNYDSPVRSIITENAGSGRRVLGLETDSEEFRADVVISNLDVIATYRDLLRDTEAPLYKRYQRLEPSSSGMVFLFGVGESFPQLSHHNIFFSADYAAEFRGLFEDLRCPDDPTVYVNVGCRSTPGDAPRGKENWFVLLNAPRDAGQDWQSERARMRAAVLKRLSIALEREIEPLIEYESGFDPPDIEKNTGAAYGSLYGISSNTKLAAFLRHPNRSRRYKGLFFCGGSAHPGGGMPLAVLSGGLAAGLAAGLASGSR